MNGEGPRQHDTEEDDDLAAHIAECGAAYRATIFGAVPVAAWAAIIEAAFYDAILGDDRAREWIQRLLGVANAARVERTVRMMAEQVSMIQVLEEAAAHRASDARGLEPLAASIDHQIAAVQFPSSPTYWSIVFDIITPSRWCKIVEVAREQAINGDPRARQWLGDLLGVDSALLEMARPDTQEDVVTISTLEHELRMERLWRNERSPED